MTIGSSISACRLEDQSVAKEGIVHPKGQPSSEGYSSSEYRPK
jgi:hypothetical protein